MRVPPNRAFITLVVAAAITLGASVSQAQMGGGGDPTGGMRLIPIGTSTPTVTTTPSFSLPRITASWFRFASSISLTRVAQPSAHALRERRASR